MSPWPSSRILRVVERREWMLAWAGIALFGVLGVAAMLLWAREGVGVFASRIIAGIESCF